MNNSYWLHRVAAGSAGLVHLTSDRRCEVVLFGDGVKLRGPFTLPVGSEFTVRVPADGGEATVTRIVKVKGDLEEKEADVPARRWRAVLGRHRPSWAAGTARRSSSIRRADRAAGADGSRS